MFKGIERRLFYPLVFVFPILSGFVPGGCHRVDECFEFEQFGCLGSPSSSRGNIIVLRHIGIKPDRMEDYSILMVKEPPEFIGKINLKNGAFLEMKDPWKVVVRVNERRSGGGKLFVSWRVGVSAAEDLYLSVSFRNGNKVRRLLVPSLEFSLEKSRITKELGDLFRGSADGNIRYFRVEFSGGVELLTLSLFEAKDVRLTRRFSFKPGNFAN